MMRFYGRLVLSNVLGRLVVRIFVFFLHCASQHIARIAVANLICASPPIARMLILHSA
jgi:hypothetical protein